VREIELDGHRSWAFRRSAEAESQAQLRDITRCEARPLPPSDPTRRVHAMVRAELAKWRQETLSPRKK
jgi:hypothetical protein